LKYSKFLTGKDSSCCQLFEHLVYWFSGYFHLSVKFNKQENRTNFEDPGTYNEQVVIPSRKASLTIYGYTSDTSGYASNQVTISHSLSADQAGGDDQSGNLNHIL
jgi:hypothetical protein